ncbi:hypothetical protein WJX73_009030 [Symbiochloris irregularis]|uniref:Uncharacterized protein n=1 Tax=Symbiochloris irregularis TaxID=706552 RepID=A0AAW1NPZ5_9CHLO
MSEQPRTSEWDRHSRSTVGPSPGLTSRKLCLLSWSCTQCKRDCFPIRSESRCLCGHRLKEHDPVDDQSSTCRCRNKSSPGPATATMRGLIINRYYKSSQ